jgi:hypothetical protein
VEGAEPEPVVAAPTVEVREPVVAAQSHIDAELAALKAELADTKAQLDEVKTRQDDAEAAALEAEDTPKEDLFRSYGFASGTVCTQILCLEGEPNAGACPPGWTCLQARPMPDPSVCLNF